MKDCNDNFVYDPLNNPKTKLDGRTFPVYTGAWRFYPDAKRYTIRSKSYYEGKYPGGIFNVKNFVSSTTNGIN